MWANLWINLFGGVDGWRGLDWGCWIAMGVVALVVIVENIVFWGFKPLPKAAEIKAQEAEDDRREKEQKEAAKREKRKYRPD